MCYFTHTRGIRALVKTDPDAEVKTEHLESGPIGREYRPEITGHAMVICRGTPRHARIRATTLYY